MIYDNRLEKTRRASSTNGRSLRRSLRSEGSAKPDYFYLQEGSIVSRYLWR